MCIMYVFMYLLYGCTYVYVFRWKLMRNCQVRVTQKITVSRIRRRKRLNQLQSQLQLWSISKRTNCSANIIWYICLWRCCNLCLTSMMPILQMGAAISGSELGHIVFRSLVAVWWWLQGQGILTTDEVEQFCEIMKKPVPLTFRISSVGRQVWCMMLRKCYSWYCCQYNTHITCSDKSQLRETIDQPFHLPENFIWCVPIYLRKLTKKFYAIT